MVAGRPSTPPPPRLVRVLRANGTARDLRPSIAPVHAHLATAARVGLRPNLECVLCLLGRRTFYAEYSILRSMRHKELTNQKTGRPFCAPLALLRQFRANVIWIVTFWLQCHISIFIAIIKLKNILSLVRGPVRRFRIAPVSKCASPLSRFRAK